MRIKLLVFATFCLIVADSSIAAERSTTPTKEQAQQMLSENFVDNSYKSRKQTLTIDSMKCGEPRKGDEWLDGTPANLDTKLTPCQISYSVVSRYTNTPQLDGIIKTDAMFVFFYNDVGDFVYRNKIGKNLHCGINGENCRKF